MELKVHKEMKQSMEKTLNVFKEDLNTVRAGRANPSMLDKVKVDYYGAMTPLNQLASVTAPEPRLINVQPYDATALQAIEKAIISADLGLNPSNDGKIIRINIPQLTEERRKDLVKMVKKMAEEAKVAIRNERRNANDELKKMEKNKDITEDDLKDGLETVQEITDEYIEKIDELIKHKEAEILEV
ncbi:ribosome recycling factor [Isachenkonia alkalipeptolytica]|uniref:Ribosome-recycling factor n=1 Tax=Isachenkonia alkalipeptolytica TaxID=2565777 RepID=A0AA43XJN9_9CLOT|nr:ribosome recycling factor [Isachenkonia alkalipeptolytica]NBG87601.1 ribosome recycling factor [Isachenkonia alkalipeptolytica]